MTAQKIIPNIFGSEIHAYRHEKDDPSYDPFKNPIIHKRINGDIIVPLNTNKLWGK